jgi:hypothetical protein
MKYLLIVLCLMLPGMGFAQKPPKLKEMKAIILSTFEPSEIPAVEIDTVVSFEDKTADQLYNTAKANAAKYAADAQAITTDDDSHTITISEKIDISSLIGPGWFAHYRKTIQTRDGRVKLTSAYMGMGKENMPLDPYLSAPFKNSISGKFDNTAIGCIYAILWEKDEDFKKLETYLTEGKNDDW